MQSTIASILEDKRFCSNNPQSEAGKRNSLKTFWASGGPTTNIRQLLGHVSQQNESFNKRGAVTSQKNKSLAKVSCRKD